MAEILLLHGPNLNLLDEREPEIYGKTGTLTDLNNMLSELAHALGHELDIRQSNDEAVLIDWIHQDKGRHWLIFNPAAFTHTSVALRDALLATKARFVEVHLSNPHRREPFRHHSYFSDIAEAVIAGCAGQSYEFALSYINQKISEE